VESHRKLIVIAEGFCYSYKAPSEWEGGELTTDPDTISGPFFRSATFRFNYLGAGDCECECGDCDGVECGCGIIVQNCECEKCVDCDGCIEAVCCDEEDCECYPCECEIIVPLFLCNSCKNGCPGKEGHFTSCWDFSHVGRGQGWIIGSCECPHNAITIDEYAAPVAAFYDSIAEDLIEELAIAEFTVEDAIVEDVEEYAVEEDADEEDAEE